jgi:hypothetical protein
MYRTMLYFHTRSQIVDGVMRNTQMRYCTNMSEYLTKARDKALKHKVTTHPLHQSDDNEIMWSYEIECKGKLRLARSVKRRFKLLNLTTKYADVQAGNHCYYTSPAHMWSLYTMNCHNSASIGTCHGTTTRKLFRTFGTKQFRVISCRVLLLRTQRKCCAHTKSRSSGVLRH